MTMGRVVDLYADPGVGNKYAPPGTIEWAQRVRLSMQSVVIDLPKSPERFAGYVDLVKQHRAWTMMNKEDGSFFATWEEFCAHRQPWGLGKPWEEIRPYLEPIVGKKTLELVTAPPAQTPPPPEPGPGRGHKKAEGHDVPKLSSRDEAADKKADRLRAVLRAPEPVQDAYRADLIGQVEAAKLGPKAPEPEDAARIVEVTRAIAPIIEAARDKGPKEKRAAKREVNAKVREMTSRPAAKASDPAPAAEPGARPRTAPLAFGDLVAHLARLDVESLRALIRHVQNHLLAKNVRVVVSFPEPEEEACS